MKNFLKLFLLFTFIYFIPTLFAQDTENYPVKIIDGNEFYVYTVKSGEGLYSISRRFNVTQSDINNINPQIQDGLKAGVSILIPKKTNQKQPTTVSSDSEKTEYILHKVEKKQTLFAISRIYNVSQDEIVEANSQIMNGLHIGDVLKIPQKSKEAKKESRKEKKQREAAEQEKENKTADKQARPIAASNLHIGKESAYITHVVQPKETLYSLSKAYGVTVDDVIRLNPDSETTLKVGTELKIPVKSKTSTATVKKVEQKDTYRIAYLLPFMLDDKSKDETVNKFVDFYMGSLLALKNNKQAGINYEVYAYDTEKSESKLYSVINRSELQKMDLIIGPAYTSQIPILNDFAKRRKIPTVIPFSSNIEELDGNPYIFQFNPDKNLQSFFVVNALKNKFQNANIVLIDIENTIQGNEENDFFNFIGNRLDRVNIDFTKVTKSNLFTNKLEKYLSTEKKNIIVFDTYKLSSVQTYLNDMYDLSKKYDVGVIGQYSWRGQAGKKPKMYYVAPFMPNFQQTADALNYEQEFTKYYGKLRGQNNPRYDILGYDITKYFLSLMNKNGFDISPDSKTLKSTGIQSDMFFKRVGDEGGFMNQQLFLIEDEPRRN
ncbi:MAG: LysM peptidoglycan-binding domain-containing protein [Paludibacteraceae bacterium]